MKKESIKQETNTPEDREKKLISIDDKISALNSKLEDTFKQEEQEKEQEKEQVKALEMWLTTVLEKLGLNNQVLQREFGGGKLSLIYSDYSDIRLDFDLVSWWVYLNNEFELSLSAYTKRSEIMAENNYKEIIWIISKTLENAIIIANQNEVIANQNKVIAGYKEATDEAIRGMNKILKTF